MKLLLPPGLLGLLGILVLILIYIIKPNYQKKIISSTFIWKLSLRYNKKKLPLSKLRNILLFLCQVLAITACAMILAQPVLPTEIRDEEEKILIIDASASMLAGEGETRFERAVSEAKKATLSAMEQNGRVSVILCGREPAYLFRRLENEARDEAERRLDALLEDPDACTLSASDVEDAMLLCEEVLSLNPRAEVVYYTATEYDTPGRVAVVNVGKDSEWNLAVLEVRPVLRENRYSFEVDVASYGKESVAGTTATVKCEIKDPNESGATLTLTQSVNCSPNEVQTVVFTTGEEDGPIASYESVHASVTVGDSFSYDNDFYLYGGRTPKLRVQYASRLANPFWSATLTGLRDAVDARWEIEITERKFVNGLWTEEPATTGFDLYIYESWVPEMLPTDGVVLLFDPPAGSEPENAGFRLGNAKSGEFSLLAREPHAITEGIDPQNIYLSLYTPVKSYDGYTPILYCNDDPVVLLKDTKDQKIMIFSFSLNYSLPTVYDFPMMLYNIYNYFMPSPVKNEAGEVTHVFEIYENAVIDAFGADVSLIGPGTDALLESFPHKAPLTRVGGYTATQSFLSGRTYTESFFVRVGAEESNISRHEGELPNPVLREEENIEDVDLLLILAAALLLLVTAEWLLHNKKES